MTTNFQVERTASDLASAWNVSVRQVSNYRQTAESTAGRTLGFKRGKTRYFSEEDVALIHRARSDGATQQQPQPQTTDQAAFTSPPPGMPISGISQLVVAGDAAAVQLGGLAGNRFAQMFTQSFTHALVGCFSDIQAEISQLPVQLATLPQPDQQLFMTAAPRRWALSAASD